MPADAAEIVRLAEIWYHVEGFTDMAEAGTLTDPPVWVADALTSEHCGDCTKIPAPCMRCHAEMAMRVGTYLHRHATPRARAAQHDHEVG